MKNITILGRRWFDKTYGNTYHSVRAIVDGEEVVSVPFHYGYGDQYQQTAYNELVKVGALQEGIASLSLYCREHDIALYTDVVDVVKKKDL
jgi:hypothetical protein